MSKLIFSTMLYRYEIHTRDDRTNALHKVMHQIALPTGMKTKAFSRLARTGLVFITAIPTACDKLSDIENKTFK